jgi:hypothetical protein
MDGEPSAATTLAFDTNLTAGLLPAMIHEVPIPKFLKSIMRSPVFSMGVDAVGDQQDPSGLPLHLHDENWLGVVRGEKQWILSTAPPNRSPATAFKRLSFEGVLVEEAKLEKMAAEQMSKNRHNEDLPKALKCVQRAGEIIYLPAGTWHATYNLQTELSGGVTLAVGGMGGSNSAIAAAVTGDLPALARLGKKNRLLGRNGQGEQAIHRASSVAVVRALDALGAAPLGSFSTASGLLPLHYYAMDGEIAQLEWVRNKLISSPNSNSDSDSDSSDAAAGAGVFCTQEAREGSRFAGQYPLHFAAAKCSLAALDWLVNQAGCPLLTPDSDKGNGQQPIHTAARYTCSTVRM